EWRVSGDRQRVGGPRVDVPGQAGEGGDVGLGEGPPAGDHLPADLQVLQVDRAHQPSAAAASGSEISSVSRVNTIRTGRSHRSSSSGVSGRFARMRGPSSSSTTPNAYGTRSANAGSAVRC